MLKKIKIYLNQFPAIRNLRSLSKSDMGLIYRREDLNNEYYLKVKGSGDRELEHQIGRLTNFKKILSEIQNNKLGGDIVEFGTWQGFSILWIAYLAEREGLLSKKIIGIDSFAGLPNSEGDFVKGMFKNTSYQVCRNNIKFSKDLYQITKKNIFIEQFLYSQKEKIIKRLGKITTGKFCLVHIDCDISSSVKEVFNILNDGELLADNCYLLFDDYGCTDSYKNTVDDLLKGLGNKWIINEHSRRNLTKNFILQKR